MPKSIYVYKITNEMTGTLIMVFYWHKFGMLDVANTASSPLLFNSSLDLFFLDIKTHYFPCDCQMIQPHCLGFSAT